MRIIFAFFVGVITLCSATIDVGIVQVGKEVIYDWETIVEAGTRQPEIYSADYRIRAKLHIQGLKDDLLGVKLTDINFVLNNGIVNPLTKLNRIFEPIPVEAQLLKLPFLVRLDTNGKVVGIVLDHTDKDWCINIKKSIASLLQIDRRQFINVEKKIGHFGITSEDTVYGLCDVKYDVLPKDDAIIVVKTQNPKLCRHFHHIIKDDSIVSTDSNRVYKLTQKDGHVHITHIETLGDTLIGVSTMHSNVHRVRVIQTLALRDEITITKEITITDQIVLNTLKVSELGTKCRELSPTTVLDITGGRTTIDKERLMTTVNTLLDELVDFIDQTHVTLTKPNIRNVRLIKKILILLEKFDLEMLEHCLVVLEEKRTNLKEQRKLNLFIQLLPSIGTRVSVVFIRNLVRKNKIEENLAIRVFMNLIDSIKCPNEKLLIEIEDLLTICNDVTKKVSRVCVLTFASLIRETFKNVDEKSAVLEKYITRFMDKLKTTEDLKTKMVYLQALSNIGIGSVLKHLDPIISGEVLVDKNLRRMALWSIAPRLKKDPMLMMKFVWPILTNWKLDTELRMIAYSIFVKTERPTMNRFMTLFWMMKYERNEKLYRFHYNTLLTLSKLKCVNSIDNCKIVDICRTILRLSRRPFNENLYDGITMYNIVDVKNGLGARVECIVLRTDFTTTLKMKVMSKLTTTLDVELLSIHLRLLNTNKNLVDPTFKKIWPTDKLSFELIMRRNGRTVMVDTQDNVDLVEIVKVLMNLETVNKDVARQLINIPIHRDRLVPTDLGIPVKLFIQVPMIQSVKFNFNMEPTMQFDIKVKLFNILCMGMEVYNPIGDLWHGIQEVRTGALSLPISLEIVKKTDSENLKLVWKKVGRDDVIGLQTFTHTETYIEGRSNKELLSKFNTNVHTHEIVKRGDNYLQNIVLVDRKLVNTGKRLEVKIFDCDRDVSRSTILNILNDIVTRNTHDTITDSSLLFFDVIRLSKLLSLTTEAGTCGVGLRILPLENVDRIEIETKINTGDIVEKILLKPMDLTWLCTITVKSNENTDLATCDSRLTLKVEELHRHFVMKWVVLQKELGVDRFKIDLDLSGKINEVDADAKVKLTIGEVNNRRTFDITIKSLRSEEQELVLKDKILPNDCCASLEHLLEPVPVDCAKILTTLRRFWIDVSVDKLDDELVINILDFMRMLGLKKTDILDRSEEHNKIITERVVKDVNHMRFDIFFPILRLDEWDVKMETSKWTELYTGIRHKMNFLHQIVFAPSSLLYTKLWLHNLVIFEKSRTCLVLKDRFLTDKNQIVMTDLSTDWTVFMRGHTAENDVFLVEVKRLTNNLVKTLAIRIKVNNDVIEIVPISDTECRVTLNGTEIKPVLGKYEKRSAFEWFLAHPKLILLRTNLFGLNIDFDGDCVRVVVPDHLVDKIEGKCIDSVPRLDA